MDWKALDVPGCHVAYLPAALDERGSFVKPFRRSMLQSVLPGFEVFESYVSTSTLGVLRGMHFQTPPHDHAKVVSVLNGRVLDVMVDLRTGPGFGRVAAIEVERGETVPVIAMPKGIAHGFLTLSDHCEMLYYVGSEYAPEHDTGILWSSIEFDWPEDQPILSKRDQAFPTLAHFRKSR